MKEKKPRRRQRPAKPVHIALEDFLTFDGIDDSNIRSLNWKSSGGLQVSSLAEIRFGRFLGLVQTGKRSAHLPKSFTSIESWSVTTVVRGGAKLNGEQPLRPPSMIVAPPGALAQVVLEADSLALCAQVGKQPPADDPVDRISVRHLLGECSMTKNAKLRMSFSYAEGDFAHALGIVPLNDYKGQVALFRALPAPQRPFRYGQGGFFTLLLGEQGNVRFRQREFVGGDVVIGGPCVTVACSVEEPTTFLSVIPYANDPPS